MPAVVRWNVKEERPTCSPTPDGLESRQQATETMQKLGPGPLYLQEIQLPWGTRTDQSITCSSSAVFPLAVLLRGFQWHG